MDTNKGYFVSLARLVLFLIWLQIVRAGNGHGHGGQKVYFMDDNPSSVKMSLNLPPTTSRDSAISVRAVRRKHPTDGTYTLSIAPPEKNGTYYVRATVRRIDLRKGVFNAVCQDKLTIGKVSVNRTSVLYSGCQTHHQTFLLDPTEEYDKFMLELKLDRLHVFQELKGGFEIVFTTLRKASGQCADYEFKCSNSLCLNKELTCNDKNNCGDNSDEQLPECSSKWSIVVVVVIAIVFVVAVVAAIVIFRKRCTAFNFGRSTVPGNVSMAAYPVNQPMATTPLYPPTNGQPVYPTAQYNMVPGPMPYNQAPGPYNQAPGPYPPAPGPYNQPPGPGLYNPPPGPYNAMPGPYPPQNITAPGVDPNNPNPPSYQTAQGHPPYPSGQPQVPPYGQENQAYKY